MQDLAIELKEATRPTSDTLPLPNHIFKPMTPKICRDINNQLGHIDAGCLSDPPGVTLHKRNPVNNKIFCCRGTNSNKNDNLYIDKLTGNQNGIGRADHLLSTYFKLSNDWKRFNQLGEDVSQFVTCKTEQLALANSLAASAGYAHNEHPSPKLLHHHSVTQFAPPTLALTYVSNCLLVKQLNRRLIRRLENKSASESVQSYLPNW